jgi:hypothetical protein
VALEFPHQDRARDLDFVVPRNAVSIFDSNSTATKTDAIVVAGISLAAGTISRVKAHGSRSNGEVDQI